MTIPELLQKERSLMKEMTFKEKAAHIWHYYKWYMLALVLLVSYISSTIISYTEADNYVLNGYFINVTGDSYTISKLSDSYLPDQREQLVYIDSMLLTSNSDIANAEDVYENYQMLIVKAHAGDVDFVVTGKAAIHQLIYNEFFQDLNEVLTPEQLAAYEGRLLYMDRAFLEMITNIDISSSLDTTIAYPDPADPESMGDPVPVLIDIRDSQWISELYPGDTGLHAFGVIVNAQHRDTAVDFLEFLLNGVEVP